MLLVLALADLQTGSSPLLLSRSFSSEEVAIHCVVNSTEHLFCHSGGSSPICQSTMGLLSILKKVSAIIILLYIITDDSHGYQLPNALFDSITV
jgi:hypothetical protein